MTHYEYKLNIISEFCNTENGKLIQDRIKEMDTIVRLESASKSPMFSFWKEIQEILIVGAEEVKQLRARVIELEKEIADAKGS